MNIISDMHNGHIVTMKTNHPLHYGNRVKQEIEKDDISTSFSQVLMNAVNKVNNLHVESEGLVQQSVFDPGSVDIHTVMIAAQKAEIALSFTKAVRDEAVRAYRDLINLR